MGKRIRRVVVVEDDSGLRQAMHRLIEAAGLHAESFDTGEALLASDATSRADCLVVDIHLPGMSGFELDRALDRGPYHPAVIFITAYDDGDTQRQARAAGAAYLVKPFAGHALLSAVNSALESQPSGDLT
ncbi:MAG: response regulator [Rhodocyclaceae bacterium]